MALYYDVVSYQKRSRLRRGERQLRRLLGALLLAVTTITVGPTVTHAEHGTEAAKRAAEQIQAAQERADAASQAMFDAESRIDALELDIAGAEKELAEMEVELATMRRGLRAQAVEALVGAGSSGDFPLMLDVDQINDGLTADVMSAISRDAVHVDVDEYGQLIDDLHDARDRLENDRDDAERAKKEFAELRATAEAEVATLAELEAQRLVDDEIEHELQARREAEAAARAELEAQRTAAAVPAADDPSESSSPGSAPSAQPAPDTTPAPPEPQPPTPTARIVCPVDGPHAFADTWGAPRSGGRNHEGVDMMAPGGTPLVAVESGSVNFKTNRLGGNAVWLTGASGTKYYYAHLSAWEGSSRAVSQGEVIGYVGNTGNTSANHLHFEVHPGGGLAVNPYPHVRAVC